MFNNSLFDNSGDKLKKVAIIFFYLMLATCLILAFALGFTTEYHGYYGSRTETHVNGLFFLFFIGGPLVSYVYALLIYALGELVEKTAANNDELRAIKGLLSVDAPNQPAAPKPATPVMPVAPVKEQPAPTVTYSAAPIKAKTFIGNCTLCNKRAVTVTEIEVPDGDGTKKAFACMECFNKSSGAEAK